MRKNNKDRKGIDSVKKDNKNNKEYFDPDSLKEKKGTEDYLKQMAALAAMFGVGAAGMAFTPAKVHAAESTVDVKSKVVGSVSEANKKQTIDSDASASDASNAQTQKSEKVQASGSKAAKQSDAQSDSGSNQKSGSNLNSSSDSANSSSGQNSHENRNSNSNSLKSNTNSKKESSSNSAKSTTASLSAVKSATDKSNNDSNNAQSGTEKDASSYSNSLIKQNSGSALNSVMGNKDSLSNSLSEARSALNANLIEVNTLNKATIGQLFGNKALLVNLTESSVDEGTKVSTWTDFQKAINNGDKVISIQNDMDMSAITIDHDVTINANGHKLYFNGNKVWLEKQIQIKMFL